MSSATQSRFAAALRDSAQTMPAGITSWSSPKPAKRFGVYRNNVSTGLTRALAIRFPAAEAIVGKEFFAAMARAFIADHPPASPVLLYYGDEFAGFVETFAPAAELPYLADVMRLENARVHAYHAADAKPLDAQSLTGIESERLATLRFVFHPSFSVIRSRHPIVTIWAMNAGEAPLAPIANWTGEDALIVRPQLTVLTHRLPTGGAAFLQRLAAGSALVDAAEAAEQDANDFDLAANLAGLLSSGAVLSAGCGPIWEA